MEKFLQVVLQWSPRQQQLMIYLVTIENPEKLESGAREGKRTGPLVATGWTTVSSFSRSL